VIEAQLTLLLRLSSARRSSVAEVTDDVHIIGKLINCKVMILLIPDDSLSVVLILVSLLLIPDEKAGFIVFFPFLRF